MFVGEGRIQEIHGGYTGDTREIQSMFSWVKAF